MNTAATKKHSIILGFFCFFVITAAAQKTTVDFARYPDGTVLQMDIYQPEVKSDSARPVVIFVFGCGFFTGSRTDKIYRPYFEFLNNKGYAVAAIDYRLGLKGSKKAPSLFNRRPLINAIAMAVEDTYVATAYLLQRAQDLNIDTAKILLSGSSAGAITVLQSDYEKRNGFNKATVLPASFQYAGVIAFAGAVYSREGKPDYKIAPAPTLLFHGDSDNIVPYNKISFLGSGIFGSKALAAKRKNDGFPYAFYTFENIGHDVALFPMLECQQEIHSFIQEHVIGKKRMFIDVDINDPGRKNRITQDLQVLMDLQQ